VTGERDAPASGRAAEAKRDLELVQETILGDERSFVSLVERYGQPILSLCYASTLDAAEAEDLAQEVFVSAWRGLRKFRGEASFSTWLFALARNACTDRARRAAARPRLAPELPLEELAPGLAFAESDRATVAAVFELAARLSLPLRQALLLRDVQGLSYEEIARLQCVPIGTVRSRIAAARSAIAGEIER
jgi:RNA polymerase sigma-70 factor (ECF subfamily)